MIFIFNSKSYDDTALSVNCLTEDCDLVASNILPMTDAVGKTISIDNYRKDVTGYVEFEVKSNIDDKVKYEIYLIKGKKDIEVPEKFVKVYLTDSEDNPLKYFEDVKVPTYYDLKLASNDASGKLIYSGSLKERASQKFKFRMWVADTYELTADELRFSAKLKVSVK